MIGNQKRNNRMSPSKREALTGLMFTAPWLTSLVIFTSYPVIASFSFSFTDYNVVRPPQWIGLENYIKIFTSDPSFPVAVRNSLYYALISVPLRLLFSLIIALLLNMRLRMVSIYRTMVYLPSLVPPVAGSMVFLLMFNPGGLVNTALRALGLPTVGWLLDPQWSKPTLIIMSLWGLGSSAIIFLAGLKEVPVSLIESAEIDGANYWQRLFRIVLPLISPIILFNLVMEIIESFQVFTQAFVIGGINGQPLESLLFYMTIIYRNAFRYFSMGYASALAILLFMAVLLITLAIYLTSGKWVFYENATRGR